jgi:hypothetical protein
MVILDRVEDARPYRAIAAGDNDVPALRKIGMTGDQARAWMANDLAEWAASRPNAPTIASTNTSAVLAALEARATTRIVEGPDHWFDNDGQRCHEQNLSVQTRQHCTLPWIHTTGFRIVTPAYRQSRPDLSGRF